MKRQRLRYGQVGGSKGAFIGAVHRNAISVTEMADLVAGCFDNRWENNEETGKFYQLDPDRIYKDYKEMALAEAQREDKIDFVDICTPNFLHYEIAKAFLEAGINVVCEKPLCFEVAEAEELQKLAHEKDLVFAVTYTYSGYSMVKLAKEMIAEGKLGDIININAEYLQEWLIDDIGNEASDTSKLSVWRKDPKYSGGSNCVGDIGTHAEEVIRYMTGLQVKRVAAVMDRFGQPLDLNANILLEMSNGCHGVINCSQVCVGHNNGLVVRIFGTKGAVEWVQEDPENLKVTMKGEPVQIYSRGTGYVQGLAATRSHLPSGHTEGLVRAFANTYEAVQTTILKKLNGEPLALEDQDYPPVEYGVEGVRFIHACLESSARDSVWVEVE